MPQPLPILVVGLVGAALFVAAGVLGWRSSGPEAMAPHLLVALAATLAWLFSQTWVAIYGLSAARPALAAGAPAAEVSLLRRAAWAWPAASTALVVATFATGAPVLTRALPRSVHLALAVAALVVQLAALQREFTLLRRQRRQLQGLAREQTVADPA